jgi:formiminotetrahydrofolate cyclodeaminase
MSGKMAAGGPSAGLAAGVAPFIEQLAAPTATPGGGSAAAAAGAMAAGLAHMVATMSRGKKAYLAFESQLSEAIPQLAALREELKLAIDADAESYNVVMKAYKAAREAADPQANPARLINAALQTATSVPLGVAERAAAIAQMVERLKPITNPNMASDLITAAALAQAALTGALANVDINLSSMKPETAEEQDFISGTQQRTAALKG